MSLNGSSFFSRGFYKKAKACPYKFGDNGEWSIRSSIESCGIPVSSENPAIVETKYNGNRGIYEFDGRSGCLYTGKKGCHKSHFPKEASELLSQHLKKIGAENVVLDGEMYLESCNVNGQKLIPGLRKQARSIKGTHKDLVDDCHFSYKVYDYIVRDGESLGRKPLEKRKELLRDILPSTLSKGNVSVEPVFGETVTSSDEIIAIAEKVIRSGGEGIIVKDPKSKYLWLRKTPDRFSVDGWWKVKNASTVNGEVTMACLGSVGKTGRNAFRYTTFQLGACKDDECDDLIPITDRGVSHPVPEGEVSGFKKWDKKLHDPIIKLLKSGAATPTWEFRSVDKVVDDIGGEPPCFSKHVKGFKNESGELGLPRCVLLPRNEMVVSVVGLEFNLDENGIPKINGPPRIHSVVEDGMASTISDILELKSVHV